MKRYSLQSNGSIKDVQGQDVNLAAITEQVTQMAQTGKLSNRDANRILKGLKTVENAVTDGVSYTLGMKNTFTAQKNGVDIDGKASGLNITGNWMDRTLSGRKVSKAIGFIASQQKDLPNPEPIQPKGITAPALDSKDIHLPSIAGTAGVAGLTFTPSVTSAKSSQEAGKKMPQATQKPVPATEKSVSAQKNVSTQKTPLAFVPTQKTMNTPVTKTRLPVREARKPLPKTVEEAIPVVDLYTVEDAAREAAAKKAVSQKARVSALSLREAALKNNSFLAKKTTLTAEPLQKQESGFFDTLSSSMRESINRQGEDEKQKNQKNAQDKKVQIHADVARLMGSERSLQSISDGMAMFKKHPHLTSYRFFIEDGITSPRYWFILTPDGRVRAEADPSVSTTFTSLPQKKEDGGLTYSLGSNLIIDPKKRFIPAINPIGINTWYQMPQKTIVPQPSTSTGQFQKGIPPTYHLPVARQVTTTGDTTTGKGIDWLRLANAGLGLAGVLSYTSAKRPILPGPVKFESTILPATGLSEASKRMAQTEIAQQTAQANQLANTADNRYNTAIKLQANYNANQAFASLAAQDSEVYQQNLQRVNEQQNRDAYLNYQAQQNYNQQKFELDNQYYQQRREMGTQMAQNALTYEVQRKADLENKRVLESQTNQQLAAMAEQAIIQANTTRSLQGKPALTVAEEETIRQRYAQSQTSNYSKPILRLAK